jgi:hypothetical protein
MGNAHVGPRGLGTDGFPAPAATGPSAVTDVAHFPGQSCGVDGLDVLHSADLTGRVLFVLVLLTHHRRLIVHFNITQHPTAQWTSQQMVEVFPDNTAPRWLLRDRDALYGDPFRRRVGEMDIREVIAGQLPGTFLHATAPCTTEVTEAFRFCLPYQKSTWELTFTNRPIITSCGCRNVPYAVLSARTAFEFNTL